MEDASSTAPVKASMKTKASRLLPKRSRSRSKDGGPTPSEASAMDLIDRADMVALLNDTTATEGLASLNDQLEQLAKTVSKMKVEHTKREAEMATDSMNNRNLISQLQGTITQLSAELAELKGDDNATAAGRMETELLTFVMSDVVPVDRTRLLAMVKQVLRTPERRVNFVQTGGVERLCVMLQADDVSPQTQYNVLLCLWLASFHPEVTADMGVVVPVITSISWKTEKTKVARMCIAVLANLTSVGTNVERMVECKLDKLLAVWQLRNWADDEVDVDLDRLSAAVTAAIASMSTFERFRSEVRSGSLIWGPRYEVDTFWRENMTELCGDKYALIRQLHQLVSSASSCSTTKAVACHSIGEFVRLCPDGRAAAVELGLKATMLGCVMNDDLEDSVRRHALLATHKMMLPHSWEALRV